MGMNESPEISFRSATPNDAELLLAWRNDEESRKNSFNREIVKEDDHLKWIEKIIGSKDNLLLIAEWDSKPVGSFRLDKFSVVGDTAVASADMRLISYVVAPEHRQKGFGRAIVAEGCVCYGQEYGLIAKIRRENVASQKILEACDFQCITDLSDSNELEKEVLIYVRPTEGRQTIQ